MSRRILVLNGRPGGDSLCRRLAERYAEAASAAGHETRLRHVDNLGADLEPPDYAAARQADGLAEGWAGAVQADLAWCDQWTIVAPMWWGGPPAALKAVLDRALLPGFAFRYRRGPTPEPLLKGRAARLILTSDTPAPWFDWAMGRPLLRQMKAQVLEFCGFGPVRLTHLSPVRSSTRRRRDAWLALAAELGARGQ